MADVVVFIRGGVFQGAISNRPNNRIMIIDYDDENDEGSAHRTFNTIPTNRELILQLIDEATQSAGAARLTP